MFEVVAAVTGIVLPVIISVLVIGSGWKRQFGYLESAVSIRDSMDKNLDQAAIDAMNELIVKQSRVLRDEVPLRRNSKYMYFGIPAILLGVGSLLWTIRLAEQMEQSDSTTPAWALLLALLPGVASYWLGAWLFGLWVTRKVQPPAS